MRPFKLIHAKYLALGLGLFVAGLADSANAGNATWLLGPGAATDTWTSATAWSPAGGPSGTDAIATFSKDFTGTQTVTGNVTLGTINFTDTAASNNGFTISTGTLTFATTAGTTPAGPSITYSNPQGTPGSSNIFALTSLGIVSSQGLTLNTNSNTNMRFTSMTWTSFTGALTLNGGNFAPQSSNQLPQAAGSYVVLGSSTTGLGFISGRNQSIVGLEGVAGSNVNGGGSLTLGVNSIAVETHTFNGNLQMGAGALTMNGAGTQILTGTNSTYTGATTITAGTLAGVGANAFGNTSGISIGGSGVLSLRADANTTFGQTTGGAAYLVSTSASGATINVDRAASGTGQTMTIGALTIGSAAATANTTFTGANNSSLSTGAVTDTTAASGTTQFTNNIASTGTLTLASFAGTRTGTPTLTFSGTGNTTVTGAITQTGTMSLTYNGSGTLTLNGANSYSGTTTISSGTVKLTGSGTLGATTSTLGAIASGAVLDLSGTSQTIAGFSGTSAGSIYNNSGAGTSTLSVTGATPGSFAGILADNNGVLTGGKLALVLNSAGTLGLSGANTFTGGTTIKAGTVGLGVSNATTVSGALGTSASTVTLGDTSGSANASLLTTGAFTFSNAIGVAAGSSGMLTIGGNSANTSTFSGVDTLSNNLTVSQVTGGTTNLTGNITSGAAGTQTLTFNNAGSISQSTGVIGGGTGTIALVQSGAGTSSLSGVNTYSGGTALNAGGIIYSATGALGTGAVTLNAASAQTVTLTLGNFLTLANAIQVNGAGTNLVVGASSAIGQVNGVNGGITLNGANLTYRQTGNGGLRLQTTGITSTGTGGNITFENNTTSNTNAGIDIRVAVNNTGTLLFGGTGNSVTNTSVLSRINATGGSIGANVTGIVQNSLVNLDFSGTTASASTATFEVDQGQVFLNNTAALRVGNVVSVASGATLDVRSSNTIAGLNNVSGSGGTVTNSNTADTVLTIGGAGTYSFGGVLQDGATNKLGFTKIGAGAQTLTGANTYTGATSITAGRLTVNGSTAAGSAVTVSGAGILGGSGNVAGTVAINSGGNIAPGNSPGTLNTGATSYNSGGTYQWEVNNVNGTKGGDPGYDFNNITGSLTIGSTSGSPFTIDVRGLNLFNMAGGVVNWNPNGFSQFTLATASGGIANYASSSFAVTTSNFTNNNSTGNGAFSVQKSGNNLVLAFNPAAGGTGPNGLVQGLGIFASDNASQSAYTGGNLNGQNGGFGYGSWSTSPSTNDSFHGQFIGDARANAAGGSGGTSGTNYSGNFINTTGAKSFGFYANSNNTSEGTRTFTGGLTTGRTFAFDFDNGYADGTSAQGFTLKNGSGTTAFEFYYTSNDGKYHITDSTGQTLTQSFTGDGFHTEFTKTGTNSYTFTISGPGVATQTFSGTLANSATDIGSFRPFNFNQFGVDTASDYNAFYNSPIVELPTFNGQSVGVGGGNFSNGALWAAHAPVNGGSIAFDGTGSIVNNDILTSVYNVAFNATVTNAGGGTGNNTTNAGPYTLTGNALTINAGVDNNSTSLQTINNNLTLGANQTFNATNGGLTFGGTLALNGKSPTINAANAVTLGGVVSGNGDIYKTGAGTLTLAAANTFTGDNTNNRGQIFVTNGSVRAGNSAALGTQTGGVSVDLGDSITGGVTTHFNNDVSLLANSGLTIPNQIYVDTNTGGSTRTIGSDGTTAATTFSGDVLLTGSAILTAATGGDTTFSGTLGTSGFTAGGVTKASAGTVILTGNNSYAGGTTVNAGTLLVNNTSGSGTGTGAVTVNNSGTVLGGTGTISGAVNVNAGAAITAGTRGSGNTIVAGNVGTFSTGALTLVSSAIFHADISGASTYDVVNVTGAVALGNSTLELNIASGISFSTPLILINNDSTDAIVGTFAGLNQGDAVTANGYTFYANYFGGTGNDFELDFTPVPEPSTWAAAILTVLALGWSQRRRLRRLGAVHRIA